MEEEMGVRRKSLTVVSNDLGRKLM